MVLKKQITKPQDKNLLTFLSERNIFSTYKSLNMMNFGFIHGPLWNPILFA